MPRLRRGGYDELVLKPLSAETMRAIAVVLLVCLPGSVNAQPRGKLVVTPAEITLTGPQSRHQLLVHRVQNGETVGWVSKEIRWKSSKPNIVAVEDGMLIPKADGTAVVVAEISGQKAKATVTVKAMKAPFAWSFRNHVLPVFSKVGCNSGACHGALAGKGGFKLSLRGFDPATDYRRITQEARGRRIELSEPGRSLILAKPSGAIPHQGGLRFDTDSREYKVISQWIGGGAEPPTSKDASLEKIEILPKSSVLRKGVSQRLLVRAYFSDGRVEDVTRWAKFASANETVAGVDQTGRVTVIGSGEGAVTAWFSSKIVIARITSPFPNPVNASVYAKAKRRNFIDDLGLKQLKRLNLPPSGRCSDSDFIRRAFLDTIGVLPTAKEVRAFLADDAKDKRDKLIDSLLKRPEFVDYWTHKWSDVLLVNGRKLRPGAVKAYYGWIRDQVKAGTPWDVFVRRILTAQGESFDNGATNFYALHQSPEEMSENASQAFLGLSIACAKCHNHPLEKWTNNQYYAMANLFARVRAKGWGGDARNGDGKRTLYVVPNGELVQPLTGKPQPPTPLDGVPLKFTDPKDRRIHLANWMVSAKNPYFSRAIANRVWANFFGVGLVEEVDDLRVSNPSSNEELLSALGAFLVKNKFALKSLMRAILQSETYQRSSSPLKENRTERRFYSRYYPRRLSAEVLLDATSQATGVPSRFTQIEFPGADIRKTDFYPLGTRAVQLYDSAVRNAFLEKFGRNPRDITCECERSNEPSMIQVLHLSNGNTLNDKLAAKKGRVTDLLNSKKRDSELLEEIYLATVCRFPSKRERDSLLPLLNTKSRTERREVLEDLFWGVMTSREFLFQH